MADLSIYANQAYDKSGIPVACLCIDSDNFSVHLWIYGNEIDLIPSVRGANWVDRQSLRIGRTAGAAAFWSTEEDCVDILIGHDDETWDIAFRIPVDALDRVYAEVSPLKTWAATAPPLPSR